MSVAHTFHGEPELEVYTEPNRHRTIATNRLPATPLANPRRTRIMCLPAEGDGALELAPEVIVLP